MRVLPRYPRNNWISDCIGKRDEGIMSSSLVFGVVKTVTHPYSSMHRAAPISPGGAMFLLSLLSPFVTRVLLFMKRRTSDLSVALRPKGGKNSTGELLPLLHH